MLEIGAGISKLYDTNLEMSLFASLASLIRWDPGHCGVEVYRLDALDLALRS